MADKKPEKKKTSSHSSGGLSFGMEVLLFMIAIFVIWILAGGAKQKQTESPLLVPNTKQVTPNGGYGQIRN